MLVFTLSTYQALYCASLEISKSLEFDLAFDPSLLEPSLKTLEEKLRCTFLINRTRGLSSEENSDIERSVDLVLANFDNSSLLRLAQLITRYNFFSSQKLMNKILEQISSKNPLIFEYFILRQNNKNPLFTPKAIFSCLETYKRKKCLGDIISILPFIDLKQTVLTFLNSNHEEKGLILFPGDKKVHNVQNEIFQRNPHMSSLFLRKFPMNCVKIFLIDSLGQRRSEEVVNLLNLTLPDFSSYSFQIYVSSPIRQRDDCSCSVFSFLDIAKIIEVVKDEIIDIFDEVKDLSLLSRKNKNFEIYYSQLPPWLMEHTQSIKQIDSFIEDFDEKEKNSSTRSCTSPVFVKIDKEGNEKIFFFSTSHLKQLVGDEIFYNAFGEVVNKLIQKESLTLQTQLLSQILK